MTYSYNAVLIMFLIYSCTRIVILCAASVVCLRLVFGPSTAGLCLQLVWGHSPVCLHSVRETKEGTLQHVQRSYFARHTLIQLKSKGWHNVSLRDSYALTINLTNKFTVTLFRHHCIGVQLQFLSGVWAVRLRPVFGPTSPRLESVSGCPVRQRCGQEQQLSVKCCSHFESIEVKWCRAVDTTCLHCSSLQAGGEVAGALRDASDASECHTGPLDVTFSIHKLSILWRTLLSLPRRNQ